ncbi:class II aldolase/adducin family protein [Hoeflea prorocentri]|uniref:Class II aldolase/adducin family protein n=1 Tax=Hoeflea prorocentri TaxID=1922333 RepID=A0A9X3UMP5_9HYPH|nr:class II aldolase/adducin family protein [Hoeflea prorocentri]MCY6381891.1 class II aldolase/adducin family protein [Hoeflea prorocentri]MDA5399691.1 class II aldolase/adducin family protein [Hoeflea prorocentri]
MIESETAVRRQLSNTYRYLHDHGLTEQASGNISARCNDHILISPGGAGGPDICADAFVRIDLEGQVKCGGTPSSEILMHLAIYRAKSEAMAVVHTHSSACVGLACCRKPIPGFHYLIGSFGGVDIPCADYACFGSRALADNVVDSLENRYACLLANHGAIAWGRSLDQAVLFAHRIEILAEQYLAACQAGEPVLLTLAEFRDYWRTAKTLKYG